MTERFNNAAGVPTTLVAPATSLTAAQTAAGGDAFSSVNIAGSNTLTAVDVGGKRWYRFTSPAHADITPINWNDVAPLPAAGSLSADFNIESFTEGGVNTQFFDFRGSAGTMCRPGWDQDGSIAIYGPDGTTVLWRSAVGIIPFGADFRVSIAVDPGTDTTNGRVRVGVWKGSPLAQVIDQEITGVNIFRSGGITSRRWGKSNGNGIITYRVTNLRTRDIYALVGPESTVIPNTAPIVNAGPDQTIEPWDSSVTLSGTYTDAEGGAVTQTWTQISGTPTVSLSGSGAVRTFVPTATIDGSTLVFRYSVTDDKGASNDDTVTVVVLPVNERAVIGGVEVPMRIIAAKSVVAAGVFDSAVFDPLVFNV